MVLSITEFIGHLHPVMVHLPIGILLLACLFLWLSQKPKFAYLRPVISIILLLGFLCAIATCVTGYLLSLSGEDDEDLVSLHQWSGISVAFLSGLTYLLYRKNRLVKWRITVAVLLAILILMTGHLGGSLTHGSDYLSKPLRIHGDTAATVKIRKPIADIQQAWVYAVMGRTHFGEKML